jgi:hypothetical protein
MDGDTDDDRPNTDNDHHHDGTDVAGDERVDAALARLDELDGVDISAHAGIYDEVHRSLVAVLDDPAVVPGQ